METIDVKLRKDDHEMLLRELSKNLDEGKQALESMHDLNDIAETIRRLTGSPKNIIEHLSQSKRMAIIEKTKEEVKRLERIVDALAGRHTVMTNAGPIKGPDIHAESNDLTEAAVSGRTGKKFIGKDIEDLQLIVDQLEFGEYESPDGEHFLKHNVAFMALKELANEDKKQDSCECMAQLLERLKPLIQELNKNDYNGLRKTSAYRNLREFLALKALSDN